MKQDKLFIFFVVGATNVGKSTFLEAVQDRYPDYIHLVEVGKQMRAKYPPAYFEGHGTLDKTEAEVIQMMKDGVLEGHAAGKRFILIDGQPRSPRQAREIIEWRECPNRERAVIELVCSKEERVRRATKRDEKHPEKLALSMARMDRDIVAIHEVFLVFTRYPVHRFNTGSPNYSPVAAFTELLKSYRVSIDEADNVL